MKGHSCLIPECYLGYYQSSSQNSTLLEKSPLEKDIPKTMASGVVPPSGDWSKYYNNPLSEASAKTIAVDVVANVAAQKFSGDKTISAKGTMMFAGADLARIALFTPVWTSIMSTSHTSAISDTLEDGVGMFIGNTLAMWLLEKTVGSGRGFEAIMKEMALTAAVSTGAHYVMPAWMKA